MHSNLGEANANTREYEIAVEYYKKEIDIQEQKLPRTNLCVIDIYNRIGDAYVKLNKFIEAQQHLTKSKNIYENNNSSKKVLSKKKIFL